MIRAACEADLTAILALEQAAATAPHWSAEVYRRLILDQAAAVESGRCVLVGEEASGALTGFVVASVMAGEGEIESVVVAAAARRQGHGRALCEAALTWCAARGATLVRLEVRASSAGAIMLYQSLGFRSSGRRPGYYADPAEDALLMDLTLQSSLTNLSS